jgi:ATP-dependent DNA helicase RecQ
MLGLPRVAELPEAVLRRHFGYSGFRPGQRELVTAVLGGRDAMGILPTGGGKSVCYQVPSLMLEGLTIVVSPLVSLMVDQVRRARDAGLPAECLHSGRSASEISSAERDLRAGVVKLLLVAPERFSSPRFQRLLPHLAVSLLTIDEAHCISMWGHDFRPAYSRLGGVRRALGAPVMALTATATPRVRTEIEASLRMRNPVRVVGSFDRANLLWAVRPAGRGREKELAIRGLLAGSSGARLVYAATRGRVEQIRNALARRGLHAEAYHAGLSPVERSRVQAYFLGDPNPVVVATNAFGMGIDRPDVRLVAHDQLPGSIEDYYQEAGRGGRDGGPALCVAFHHPHDRRLHESFLDRTHPPIASLARLRQLGFGRSLDDVVFRFRMRRAGTAKMAGVYRYARSKKCRRALLLSWFGERSAPGACAGCDGCLGWPGVLERVALL